MTVYINVYINLILYQVYIYRAALYIVSWPVVSAMEICKICDISPQYDGILVQKCVHDDGPSIKTFGINSL